jgi:hypothetical protein
VRLGIAFAFALAAIWFGLVDNSWLDRRPVQRLLFLGHSYTYYNDMPAMVAKMADSADSPVRYDVTMSAFPNASLEDHWNNRKTRELLSRGGWYRVIAQPETSSRLEEADSSLYVYGRKLLVGTGEQPPAIIISHLATDAFYRRQHWTTRRSDHAKILEENLRGLAIATGADVIDVARIWDRVRAKELPFPLYKDGNHPSLEGSYLVALVVYASIAHADVTTVTYVPWRMSSDHAALLRERVQTALTVDS